MIGQIFFNEVRASFNLRKPKSDKPTNIYLVCRIDKKQVKLSTGVRVYPDQWNTKKQEAYVSPRLTELDNINNAIVNDEINKLRTDFLEFKRYIICGRCLFYNPRLCKYVRTQRKSKLLSAHVIENENFLLVSERLAV